MLKKASAPFISFLQAIGLILYCGLVGMIMWKGEDLFGKLNNILGPILFLSLFVLSALICALIALGYPLLIFWDKKNTKEALKIVFYTALWLASFILLYMTILLFI